MGKRFRRAILGCIGGAVALLFGVILAVGQSQPGQKPLMAEEAFKNVQLLRGIPADEFLETMGFFSASLNMNCVDCHVEQSSGNWAKYADDTEKKQTTRRMILMMRSINQSYFAGRRVVTCWSCHRGTDRPKVRPTLDAVYGVPPLEEPDVITQQDPDAPSVDQVLDKYIRALGGTQRLSSLTSFVATGSYQGYGEGEANAVEIFAKAPNQRATIVHAPGGDNISIFDGQAGWIAKPQTDAPVPVLTLTGGNLDGAKVEAQLAFPIHIKQMLSDWRVGVTSIDDRDFNVVQGNASGGSIVKLYFDRDAGLLTRLVRYTDSPVGLTTTQIDYSDYREISGVKMPFRWSVTWLDGRSITSLTDVRPNVAIDGSRFMKPSPPPKRIIR